MWLMSYKVFMANVLLQTLGTWHRGSWRFSNLPANTAATIFRVNISAGLHKPLHRSQSVWSCDWTKWRMGAINMGMATNLFILKRNCLNKNRIYEWWNGKDLSRKQSWPNQGYYPGTSFEGLNKIMESLGHNCCVEVQIWAKYLLNISREHYCYTNLLGKISTELAKDIGSKQNLSPMFLISRHKSKDTCSVDSWYFRKSLYASLKCPVNYSWHTLAHAIIRGAFKF